jgi:glutathione S-transferase
VQSGSILRHLARVHRLNGADFRDAARCDLVHEGALDARLQLQRLRGATPEKRDAVRNELVQVVIPRWLGSFERLLAGQDHFVGAFSYADLAVWYWLETLRDNDLDLALDGFPALLAFEARVRHRPSIARYLARPDRFPPQRLEG